MRLQLCFVHPIVTKLFVAVWVGANVLEWANVLKKWQSLPGIVSLNHDGQMNFEVIGVDGTQCDIEASVDLKKWSRVDQVTLENGRASFLDARRIWLPHCFYRVKAVE